MKIKLIKSFVVSSLLSTSLLSSCVHATRDNITAFGGKGAYKSPGTGGFTLVYDNQKSFRDGALALTTIAAAAASSFATAAAEASNQVASQAAAKTAQNKIASDTVIQTTQITATKDVSLKALEVAPP